ncbi:colicin immunity domain-containing protein [Massilia agilis]|uniref:Colicin immunity domain-containing protein n=1 Tax=Massilia agilis TaxID=1811226 RepID=A0ABT2D6J5_9BURK|nr:colicin immunity domain-containing protein [Massilia agilis]MCS0806934.1 colicin immunity domain-containing protein [Massilia agilis]
MSNVAQDYRDLLQRFLSNQLEAQEFQTAYLEKFQNEKRHLSEELYEVLDALFGDVDAFCPDPELLAKLNADLPGFYLSEPVLRTRVERAFALLANLQHISGVK